MKSKETSPEYKYQAGLMLGSFFRIFVRDGSIGNNGSSTRAISANGDRHPRLDVSESALQVVDVNLGSPHSKRDLIGGLFFRISNCNGICRNGENGLGRNGFESFRNRWPIGMPSLGMRP